MNLEVEELLSKVKKLYSTWFGNYWSPYLVMALAGILSAVYFGITHTVWAVTGEFTRLGGHLLEFVGVDVSGWAYFDLVHMNGTTWTRTDGWIVWGMFIGALITILLSGNFKIRMPRQKRRYVQGFAGGIIAGFGARLALGCNLAAFLPVCLSSRSMPGSSSWLRGQALSLAPSWSTQDGGKASPC